MNGFLPRCSEWRIYFSLFGVPVCVQPMAWATLALLGGALRITRAGDVPPVLLFMAAGFLCVLAHELGHALAARRFGASEIHVVITALGGLTRFRTALPSRTQQLWITAAGPLASLLWGALLALLWGVAAGDALGGLKCLFTLPLFGELALPQLPPFPPMLHLFWLYSLCVSLWWSLLNLLPIYPMDGGQILALALPQRRLVIYIGFVTTALLTIAAVWAEQWFMAALAAYMLYEQWKDIRNKSVY